MSSTTTTANPSPALAALLAGPGRRLSVQTDGRIKCNLTGHVMPAKEDVVVAYVRGAKYTRRAADADECDQIATSEPSLKPSKNFPGKWYCSLTCHVISATPSALRKHLEGKKIAFAKSLVEKGEHETISEPELEEDEKEEEEEEEEEEEALTEGVEEEEEKEEEKEKGGAKRKGAAAAAAAAAAASKKAADKNKKKSRVVPPRTPEENSKGKGRASASRPSRPKRVRKG